MKKRYKDSMAGIFLFVVGTIYFIYSFQIQQATDVGARTLPQFLGMLLIILSVILFAKGLLAGEQAKADKQDEAHGEQPNYLRVLLTFILLALFVAILKPVGFCVSSFIYLFLQMMLLVRKENRSNQVLLKVILIALVVSVSLTLIFVKGFSIMLPPGITEFLY